MHEVPNVFVVDGSAFPTASEKNPTLTIVALNWRATDNLAELIRRGEQNLSTVPIALRTS